MKIKLIIALLFLAQVCVKAQKPRENPILTTLNQPIQFGSITAQDVENATKISMEQAKTTLAKIYNIPTSKRTFANTLLATDDLLDKFYTVYSSVNILLNASPDTAIQNASNRSIQEFALFANQLTLDENYI